MTLFVWENPKFFCLEFNTLEIKIDVVNEVVAINAITSVKGIKVSSTRIRIFLNPRLFFPDTASVLLRRSSLG